MATVTVFTAARMLAIEAASVVSGRIVDNRLKLSRRDGMVLDAGELPRGLPGVNAVANDEATATYIRSGGSETNLALDEAINGSDLVTSAPGPLYFAHRDGGHRFPEECVEAVEACINSGFVVELDLQLLSDGTVVAHHDGTTGRTMTGTNVTAANLTLSEWRQRRVKPVISGGKDGEPIVLDDLLDRFGRLGLWSFEIKSGGTAACDAAMLIVKERRMVGRVLWSSFDYNICKYLAAGGMLTKGLTDSINPATLKADGMVGAAVSTTASDAYIASCIAEGLRVYQWTITNSQDAKTSFAKGVHGVYTDEPWRTSRRFPASTKVDLSSGTPGPFLKTFSQTQSGTNWAKVVVDPLRESLLYTHSSTPTAAALASVRLGELGEGVMTGAKIRWSARYLPGAQESSRWWGLYFGSFWPNTTNADEPYINQNGQLDGYLLLVRRMGDEVVYRHPPNAGGIIIGTRNRGVGSWNPTDSNSGSAWCDYEMEWTATSIIVTNFTTNQVLTIVEDPAIGGGLARTTDASVHFMINGTSAEIKNVRMTRPRV